MPSGRSCDDDDVEEGGSGVKEGGKEEVEVVVDVVVVLGASISACVSLHCTISYLCPLHHLLSPLPYLLPPSLFLPWRQISVDVLRNLFVQLSIVHQCTHALATQELHDSIEIHPSILFSSCFASAASASCSSSASEVEDLQYVIVIVVCFVRMVSGIAISDQGRLEERVPLFCPLLLFSLLLFFTFFSSCLISSYSRTPSKEWILSKRDFARSEALPLWCVDELYT